MKYFLGVITRLLQVKRGHILKLQSRLEISHLQQQASLVATIDRRLHNSTNANAKTNVLSSTAGCKEYSGSSQFIGSSLVVLQLSRDPLVGWGGMKFGHVDSQENRYKKPS